MPLDSYLTQTEAERRQDHQNRLTIQALTGKKMLTGVYEGWFSFNIRNGVALVNPAATVGVTIDCKPKNGPILFHGWYCNLEEALNEIAWLR